MRIYITRIFVDDQQKALGFYTDTLGFVTKNDVPMGEHRWLTVTSAKDTSGPELLLEPSVHPAVGPYREALLSDGIPAASFQVTDLDAEYHRLRDLGVEFVQTPTDMVEVKAAVLNDGCGNLIQLVELIN